MSGCPIMVLLTFAFHYHYSTTDEEPASKRRRVEHDPNLLPNYDLTQPLEGFPNREHGVKDFSSFLKRARN